ncbi:metal-dependent transcriptional regulator [Konateibacter massiliensis]|uniref:metal-dependent transcriptional regulator n=1 Tax=Konateibacter massiliensis TaxID=2002841 RepID=UPI000C15B54C|nr:iron dependent repressor, metal binding and dimerization domain protein [Konateibacter massiliensis]
MVNNEFHTVRGYQLLEQNKNKLTSAMEDYLEMIYRNSLKDGYIRIHLLAELLHVKAASASRMVQKLGEMGLLHYKKYGIIVLSESGKNLGEYLLERHNIIENFLKIINCENDLLQQTELMEHSVNPKTVDSINILNHFFHMNKNISDSFNEYQKNFHGE